MTTKRRRTIKGGTMSKSEKLRFQKLARAMVAAAGDRINLQHYIIERADVADSSIGRVLVAALDDTFAASPASILSGWWDLLVGFAPDFNVDIPPHEVYVAPRPSSARDLLREEEPAAEPAARNDSPAGSNSLALRKIIGGLLAIADRTDDQHRAMRLRVVCDELEEIRTQENT